MQEDMKEEPVEITYSYWDGSGHRKVVSVSRVRNAAVAPRLPIDSACSQCKKGDTIAQFLEKCRAQFPELRAISVDNLMYIKEDLIIPHVRSGSQVTPFGSPD